MIVKIQRPLLTTDNPPMALVYNADRSFHAHMKWTPDIIDLFRDGSLKVYHKAKLRRGQLLIGKRVREQDW